MYPCLFLLLFVETSSGAIDAEALYTHWCSQCHGLTGKGDGVNSTPDMAINPHNHTDSAFMSTRSDEQFEEVIRGGGTALAKSPLMPPWSKTLKEEEIKALVRYLRKLCNCEFEGVVGHEKLKRTDAGFR
jgi:mono/diheme cytochrome c family protein